MRQLAIVQCMHQYRKGRRGVLSLESWVNSLKIKSFEYGRNSFHYSFFFCMVIHFGKPPLNLSSGLSCIIIAPPMNLSSRRDLDVDCKRPKNQSILFDLVLLNGKIMEAVVFSLVTCIQRLESQGMIWPSAHTAFKYLLIPLTPHLFLLTKAKFDHISLLWKSSSSLLLLF